MLTQAQLCQRLSELGISRTERVLTDWREKGLLPPLRQASLGRGGSIWSWDDDEEVLEHAIAVDCLLTKYARTNEALFALWQSGYAVDAASAKEAWIERLEVQHESAAKAAAKFIGGYLSLGRSLWRLFGKRPWLRDFTVPLIEASFDDTARDDDDYRARMAEVIDISEALSAREVRDFLLTLLCEGWDKSRSGSKREEPRTAPLRRAVANCLDLVCDAAESLFDEGEQERKDTDTFVNKVWANSQLQTLLVNRASIEHVRSMTLREVEAARRSLCDVRKIVGRCVELTNDSLHERLGVQAQLIFMAAAGLVIGNQLITYSRLQPEWPLVQTISKLRAFVFMVEFKDLSRHDNNKYQASGRVLDAWTATRLELSHLWSAVTKPTPK
jgi:hypothetical protein